MPEMVKSGSEGYGNEEGMQASSSGDSSSKAIIDPEGDPYKYTVDDSGSIGVISEDGSEMLLKPGLMEKAVREALGPLAKGTPAYDLLMKDSGGDMEEGGKEEGGEDKQMSDYSDPMEMMEMLKKKAISKHMKPKKKMMEKGSEDSEESDESEKDYA